jgi:Na+-transporting methylmalonyl-CoA/oxaloacetate decarboxylase gamma subunit
MDNFTFGWVMVVLGMGVTLITLWILTLIIRLMNKWFPFKEETK